jgi:LacI family transcriptional regulator
VLEACRLADAAVPEDVAVLGVDNDETFCSLADPPLSSIVLDAETAGYSAAALLDGMKRGGARNNLRVRVQATRVVTRRSTDIFAVDDSDVSQALRFIRKRQGRGISVGDVAEEVALSRRSLEKRFLNAIGRTVHEEIQRARLQYAKQLLIKTGPSISKVAAFAGFSSTGSFVQFFRNRVGASPADFRGNSMR